jgi:Leucine Rich repeat
LRIEYCKQYSAREVPINRSFVVTGLLNLRVVNLSMYMELANENVSLLGSVYDLDLSGTLISDVSALHNVSILKLNYCSNLTDVSALSENNEELYLDFTGGKDVSMLGGARTLSLSHTDVTDVSALLNVDNLCLDCTLVVDVSMLGNVRVLRLRGCSQIKTYGRLSNVQTLDLAYNQNLTDEDVQYMTNVHVLSLHANHDISKLPTQLPNLRLLDISFTDIRAIPNLDEIHKVCASEIIGEDPLTYIHGIKTETDWTYSIFSECMDIFSFFPCF